MHPVDIPAGELNAFDLPPVCIEQDTLSLVIPNGPAAHAIAGHLLAGLHPPAWDDGGGLDVSGAPARAVCARHEDIAANRTCFRCGAFMCPRCEHRVRQEAMPLCPGCWELRRRARVRE
ncbi:hypothetical protein [Corallococcus sp. RDP092CA]|uniref:hypothetical protein n=1 Tax=Corallococcus sp. RDP092CA TaxID=3109369 RepID=UPI0035B0D8C6